MESARAAKNRQNQCKSLLGSRFSATKARVSYENSTKRFASTAFFRILLARRLHAIYGDKLAVVNGGIGGNQVVGPAKYSPQEPFPGGPSAKDPLDRDVLSLSGVAAVIWLEGINDFSKNGNAPVEAVETGMKEIVGRIRTK